MRTISKFLLKKRLYSRFICHVFKVACIVVTLLNLHCSQSWVKCECAGADSVSLNMDSDTADMTVETNDADFC